MSDLGDHARNLHREALDWDMRGVTVLTIHEAFARRLTGYNDAQVMMGLPVLALQDPRDVLEHVAGLVEQMRLAMPGMGTVLALGAQVTALALAIARAEDSRFELGDAT